MAKHNEIALETARQGVVLLKNDGILPLATPVNGKDRRYRRVRPRRSADGLGVQHGNAARWLRGRHSHRWAGDNGWGAFPISCSLPRLSSR